MDRRIRYEVLHNEDDSPAEPVETEVTVQVDAPQDEVVPPPAYNTNEEQGATAFVLLPTDPSDPGPDGNKILEPPSYNVATSLPSYEEAERTKQEEAEQQEIDQQVVLDAPTQPDTTLGTDGIFLCTFIFSFLFNWLGLLVSMCLSQTIAARFGAVAGFGLSVVKWVAIVKHNHWTGGWGDGNAWFWWFLMFLGFLMFSRGCIQYVRIKHQWSRLSREMRGRVYLYF